MAITEEELNKLNRKAANTIRAMLPKEAGFALLVFSNGPGGYMTYCSSAQRQDMIKAMRETISKLEGGDSA